MKQRMFSMVLVIMLLFTSVDVSAFAMEVREDDIVEVQEIPEFSNAEETMKVETADDAVEILTTVLEEDSQADLLEDDGLLGVVYLPEQEEYTNQEEVHISNKYGEKVGRSNNEDLITVLLDEYVSYLNEYIETTDEVPEWLSESSKEGIDLHMEDFRSEMEEETLELLEYNATVKVSDMTEEDGMIHLNAVEFIDVIAEDSECSYDFTIAYKLNLQIDSSQNRITQLEAVRIVDEEGEDTDNSTNEEPEDELETMASAMRLRAAEIAYGEIGTVGGSKYWGNSPDNWCVDFAKWCVRQAGLDSTRWGDTRKTTVLTQWFYNKGRWRNKLAVKWEYNGIKIPGGVSSYIPQPGDFAAVDNNGYNAGKPLVEDGPEHTALVYSVDKNAGTFTTVEGNMGGEGIYSSKVIKRTYSLSTYKLTSGSSYENSYVQIIGFGEPDYPDSCQQPKGDVDLVEGGNGTVRVCGWAFDYDDTSVPVDVHIYVGGKSGSGAKGYGITANQERTDVHNAFGVGKNHGFDVTLKVDVRGSQPVYIYAIDVGKDYMGNPEIGSGTANIKNIPFSINYENSKIEVKTGEEVEANFTFTGDGIYTLGYEFADSTLAEVLKYKNVNWTTGDATMVLKGVKPGTTTVKVHLLDVNLKSLYSKAITVTVKQPVTGVSLNKTSLSLNVGQTQALTATVSPSNASNKTVSWSSSKSSVASVSNGTITAKEPGTSIVSAKTSDGGYIARCTVTVKQPVTGVSLNKTSLSLNVGKTETLTATVSPSNASNKAVSWSSSNTSVATVSNGTITAKAAGTATIKVKTTDGSYTASCTVTVKQPVTGVSLNKTSLSLNVGKTETLTATVSPSNASNKAVSWSSSNTSVATVSNGTITAKAAGTATIKVKTTDGSYTASCTVTVKQPVTGVELDKATMNLTVGQMQSLTATVSPSNASDKTVSWNSDNTGVATVSNGTITAKAAGTAIITVSTTDGNYSASCTVTVITGTYTIHFDKNGSDVSGEMPSQSIREGANDILNANQFVRNGYRFAGWNTKADGTGTAYSDRAGVSSLASGEVTQVTLYAQWEKIQQVSRPVASVYTGSIVTEGTAVVLSCGESGAEIYYTTDNTVPTKDSCLYTSPIDIYEDMVIKAVAFKDGYQNSEVAVFEYFLKEKNQYTILFDKNRSDAEGTMSSQTFEEGSGVFLNKNLFSCTGYNFVGWNTSADGSGTFYADRTAVSRMEFDGTTMTLYAQWERILKVSTPKADIASGSVVEYQTQVTLSCEDEEVEIHYTTDGSIPTKDSPEYTTPIVITEAITIKAVAFREGYEDSDVFEVSYTVAVENSVYTILFDKNSSQAVGEMAVQTLPEDGVVFLNSNGFVRDGYYFTGWNTEADGTGTTYEEGALLFGFDMGSEKVITLYAQWKKMEQLTAPVADVKNGSTVRKGTKVSLEHSLKQVQIYYTTDGTLPTTDSNFYVEPVVIEEDTVITAIAVKENYMPSEPVEFIYKVAGTGELLEEDIPAGGLEDVPEGLWIAGINPNGYTYTGKAIKPEVRVYDHTTLLEEKKDYTISYGKNVNASEAGNAKKTPVITVKGKGNYTGRDTAEFKINPKSIASEGILAQDVSAAYNKKQQKPVPVVYDNGKKLKNKKDYTLEYVGLGTRQGAFQEPGTYRILIYGTGNYSGVRVVNFVITDSNLISKATVGKIKNQPYQDGEEVRPEITVKYKGQELVENSDYILSYLNNTKPGKATVVIQGVNAFSGVKYVDFTIQAVSLKNAEVSGIHDGVYTGGEVTFDGISVYADRQLEEGEDYTIEYRNHDKVGKATVVITGINGYTGSIKKTFRITPYNMAGDPEGIMQIYMEEQAEYVKGGTKAKVVLKFANRVLKENKDYTVKYTNVESVMEEDRYGDAVSMVTISGKGNFTGSLTKQYRIVRKNISGLKIEVSDVVFKNKAGAWKSVPKIYDVNGKMLKSGSDYEKGMTYVYAKNTVLVDGTVRKAGEEIGAKDIVPAGTLLRIIITGTGKYEGMAIAEYRMVQQSIAKAKVKIPAQIYTGKEIELDKNVISVTCGKQKLLNTDYEITGYQKNIAKGTAKVTIKGMENYGGTKTVTFKIQSKKFSWWR